MDRMGRSPIFCKYVQYHPYSILSSDLSNLFQQACTIQEEHMDPFGIIAYSPCTFFKMHPVRLRITEIIIPPCITFDLSKPIMERCCSTYGKHDHYFPKQDEIYHIIAAEKYRLMSGHVYDIFVVMFHDNNSIITWVLRTDGVVLNAESFQVRGKVDIEILE